MHKTMATMLKRLLPMRYLCLSAAAMLLGHAGVEAAIVSFTGSGSAEGKSVSAEAEFVLGNGSVDLTLWNTTPSTYSFAQVLTGIKFTITDATGNATLTSAEALQRDVDSDKTYQDSGIVSLLTPDTTWKLGDASHDSFQLEFHPDAEFGIIGPPEANNKYSKANGSVAGNNGHNPLAGLSATFSLTIPGLTNSSVVSSVVFLYGSNLNIYVTGIPDTPPNEPEDPPTQHVPEPGTAALTLTACLLIKGSRRFNRPAA